MDSSDVIVNTKDEVRNFNATKLGELLAILNIKEAYYIDDYNKIDILPLVITSAKSLFVLGKTDVLATIFEEKIEINVPDEDVFGEQIYTTWDSFLDAEKEKITLQILSSNESDFNILDYTRTRELQQSFPKEHLKLINPDEWESIFSELEKKYNGDSKVLILFDQDLSKAEGERFKNGAILGQHLILNLKKSSIKDNVYCALITHLITDTSQELTERDKIIESLNKGLTEKDFFALAKDRIKSPDLLCDGIKKSLLNGYCEEMKERSKKLIEDAQKNALKRVSELDTYDFDHTVLRSSYTEGVWEMNTLFRIAGNFYTDEVKKLMGDSKYAKEVNPYIKKAKVISDVRFNIEPGTIPYQQKYSLRHKDIYEDKIINSLHLPLENGDIFQITEGRGKGYYILVTQECDLMMRTSPLGSRSSETATLLSIKDLTRKQLDDLIIKYYEINSSDSHFFANKFRLDYFKDKTNDIGLVRFTDSHIVNLDVLDLCVFDNEGHAKLDLASSFDQNLVSTAWENRYKKLYDKFKKHADALDKLLPEVEKLGTDAKKQIKKKIAVKFAPFSDLGIVDNYSNRNFDFGLKRVWRLKPDGAKYLLDRFYKHHSRTAELHDFAFEERFIKEGIKAIQEETVSVKQESSNAIEMENNTPLDNTNNSIICNPG